MIRDAAYWYNSLGEVGSLSELRGCRVAIEAAYFLEKHILRTGAQPPEEPLLPALGGLPLAFDWRIREYLQRFEDAGVEPLFVFGGVDTVQPPDPFRKRQQGEAVNAAAWALYDNHQAEESVRKFGESTYVQPEDLFRAFQRILVDKRIAFNVAPYCAWSQLAYLDQAKEGNDKLVHAVSGSSELLLFSCDKFITSWDFANNRFHFIRRVRCINDLRSHVGNPNLSEDVFIDACLLAGSHFLPTLQNLESEPRKNIPKPRAAVEMIVNARGDGYSVVRNLMDEPKLKEIDYLDKYRRARLQVMHQPILTKEGHLKTMAQEKLTGDCHKFIGPRMPDEMAYYLSVGLLSPRMLQWRANSQIIESQPVDGGDSNEYKTLVSSKLTPLRVTAMDLLFSFAHRWFTKTDLELKCWFIDPSGTEHHTSAVKLKDSPGITKDEVEMWNVKDAAIKDVFSRHEECGPLGAAILALKNDDFVAKSSSKKDLKNPLKTPDEIICNTIWRSLALREYVDQNHNLTAWGKVMADVISALNGDAALEEAAVVAVELIRLGVLHENADMFPNYNGAPMRGELKDRQFNLLISRVAGLGTLQHKPIGFTGPLSQHLLGYDSVINAVRTTMRDFVEASVTQIFGGGFADRDSFELESLAMKLPFLLPTNCALSIAVKTYLDELLSQQDPTSAEAKAAVLHRMSTMYFPQSIDFQGDLKMAFKLWDAVYKGVERSGNLVKESDKRVWGEANAWLAGLR